MRALNNATRRRSSRVVFGGFVILKAFLSQAASRRHDLEKERPCLKFSNVAVFTEIDTWCCFFLPVNFCVETKIILKYFSRGSVSTGGPTASRACENWRVPRPGAAPNPDEPLVPVPVPGGAGCFRAENYSNFVLKMFVLKIGPDWGIVSRANIGGQRFFAPRATPHTKPGVGAGDGSSWEFLLVRSKQATAG